MLCSVAGRHVERPQALDEHRLSATGCLEPIGDPRRSSSSRWRHFPAHRRPSLPAGKGRSPGSVEATSSGAGCISDEPEFGVILNVPEKDMRKCLSYAIIPASLNAGRLVDRVSRRWRL